MRNQDLGYTEILKEKLKNLVISRCFSKHLPGLIMKED